MSERIRFTVTQEHINAGCSEHAADVNCPIALALKKAAPDKDWHVWGAIRGERVGLVTEGPLEFAGGKRDWHLSRAAVRFIRAFDSGKPVAPFTGEVYR